VSRSDSSVLVGSRIHGSRESRRIEIVALRGSSRVDFRAEGSRSLIWRVIVHLSGRVAEGGDSVLASRARSSGAGGTLSFCRSFFSRYNDEHRHSGIAYMTPRAMHYGESSTIHVARSATFVLDCASEYKFVVTSTDLRAS